MNNYHFLLILVVCLPVRASDYAGDLFWQTPDVLGHVCENLDTEDIRSLSSVSKELSLSMPYLPEAQAKFDSANFCNVIYINEKSNLIDVTMSIMGLMSVYAQDRVNSPHAKVLIKKTANAFYRVSCSDIVLKMHDEIAYPLCEILKSDTDCQDEYPTKKRYRNVLCYGLKYVFSGTLGVKLCNNPHCSHLTTLPLQIVPGSTIDCLKKALEENGNLK